MDIRAECQGSGTDYRKPGPALFNYDGDPGDEIIKAHLLAHVLEYRDDLSEYDRNMAGATVNLDGFTGEGLAIIQVGKEEFQFRLFVNQDIPRGASVRVSAYEVVDHGAYGVLVDDNATVDVWTVEMLDGGKVQYERDELADLSERTTVDGGTSLAAPATDPAFGIGEVVNYHQNVGARGEYLDSGIAVRVSRRRYVRSFVNDPDGGWAYFARPVDGSGAEMALGERTLAKLPTNLQNLVILERQS